MSPASKKRKQSDGGSGGASSSKGKGKAPELPSDDDEGNAAVVVGGDDDPFDAEADEDDLEGLVGEVLNGEIDDEAAADGASHSAVEVLRAGFEPLVVEDERPADECEDGHAHAEAGNAEDLMQWLIAPVDLRQFMDHIWERRAMYVSRNANKAYYDGWLSKGDIDAWLRGGKMRYSLNVDVTSYKDGVRRTHNVNDDGSGAPDEDGNPGVADADTVWRRFDDEGCSLRVLHPQRWRDPLWKMLSSLERFWRCSTGCNCYLTPPDSQGFSPHFDDIDAFVLQLEGKKRWRVYPPRSEDEMLPRYSSPNFDQSEIGEPVLEVVLEPGDVLYMPRGTVHQASCVPGAHSLHVTVSTNQFNTWADVLELAIPAAIERAVAEIPALRRCPPPDFLDRLGVHAQGGDEVGADEDGDGNADAAAANARRDAFVGVLNELASAVMRRLPLDSAADQLGKRLMKQRLPPPPSHLSAPASKTGEDAAARVTSASTVRLMQEGGARMVVEDDAVAVYHSFANGRLYHMEGGDDDDDDAGDDAGKDEGEDDEEGEDDAEELGALRFEPEAGPMLEHLLHDEDAAEVGVGVADLPLWPEEAKLDAVRRLVRAGVLAVVD